VLHSEHRESGEGIWKKAFNLAFVGRTFWAIFQRNKKSLAFSLSFQRDFQELDSRGDETEEILGLLINLYVELVESRPFVEGVQRKGGLRL
jgi:hypothetical protein